eukprot:Seg1692.3 transcript_id=Seg1692.3/GoldUCD/mRNA.D3Y31 product="Carboxypeptidase A4" protein_id=Seg1692.3/GoldUCD/D3Y31
MNGNSEELFSKETTGNDQTRKDCLWAEPGQLSHIKSRLQLISSAVGKKLLEQGESKEREEIKSCDQVVVKENNLEEESPIWASFEVTNSAGSDNVGNGDFINARKETTSSVMIEGKEQGDQLVQSAENEATPIWLVGNSGEDCEDMITDTVDSDEEDMLLGNDLVVDEEISEEGEEINEKELLGSPEKMGESEKKVTDETSERSGPHLQGEEARSNLINAASSHSEDVVVGGFQQDEKQVETDSLSSLEKVVRGQNMNEEEISEADKADLIIGEELLKGGKEMGRCDREMKNEEISEAERGDLIIGEELSGGEMEKMGRCDEEMNDEEMSEAQRGDHIIDEELSDEGREIEKGSSSSIEKVGQCMENEGNEPVSGAETNVDVKNADSSQVGALVLLDNGEEDFGTESNCKDVENGSYLERTDGELQVTDSLQVEEDGTQGNREPNLSEIKGLDAVGSEEETTSDVAMGQRAEQDDLSNADEERSNPEDIIVDREKDRMGHKAEQDDLSHADEERSNPKDIIIDREMGRLCKPGEDKETDEELIDARLSLPGAEDKTCEAGKLNETRDGEIRKRDNLDIMEGRDDVEKVDNEIGSESKQVKECDIVCSQGRIEGSLEAENSVEAHEFVSPMDHSERKSSFTNKSENFEEEQASTDVNSNEKGVEDSKNSQFIGDGEQMSEKGNKELKDSVAGNESVVRIFEQINEAFDDDQLIPGDNKTASTKDEQNALHDNGTVTEEEVEAVEGNETEERGKNVEFQEAECVTENKERLEDDNEIILEFFEEEHEENVDVKDDKEYAEDSINVRVIGDNTLEEGEGRSISTNGERSTASDVLEQEARRNIKRVENIDQGTHSERRENALQGTNERNSERVENTDQGTHSEREENAEQGTNNLEMDELGSVNQASECKTSDNFDETVITEITTEKQVDNDGDASSKEEQSNMIPSEPPVITEITTENQVDDDGDASSEEERNDMIPSEPPVIIEITTEKQVDDDVDASSKEERNDMIPSEPPVITEITTDIEVDDDANSKQEGGMIPAEPETGDKRNTENATDSLVTLQKENNCDESNNIRADAQSMGTETDETMETNTDRCVSSLQTNTISVSHEITKDTAEENEKGEIVDTMVDMDTRRTVVACKADVTDEIVDETQDGLLQQDSVQKGPKYGNEQTEIVEAEEGYDSSEKTGTNQGTIEGTDDCMLQESSVLKVNKIGNDHLKSDKVQGDDSAEKPGLVAVRSGEQELEQVAMNDVLVQKNNSDAVTEEEVKEKSGLERDGRQSSEQEAAIRIRDEKGRYKSVTEEEAQEISKLKRVKLNISNAIKALSSRIKTEPIDSSEAIGTSARKANSSGSDKTQLGDLPHEKVVIKQEPIDDYEYPTQTNDVIATDRPVDESIVKQEDCAPSSENVFDMIRSENEIVKEQEAMEIASSLFFDPPDSDSDESENGPVADVVRYGEESRSSEEGGQQVGGVAELGDDTNGSSTWSATSPAQDDNSRDTSETDSDSEDTSNNGPNTNGKNLTAAQRLIEKFRLQIQGKRGQNAAQPKKTPREKLMPAELIRKKEGEKETELVRKKTNKSKKTNKQTVSKRKAETVSEKTQAKTKRAKIDEAIHKNELEIVKALQGKAATLKIPATLLQDRIKTATGKGLKTNAPSQARLASEKTSKNLRTIQPSNLRQANERKKTVMTPSVNERSKEARETTLRNTGTISIGTESLLNQDEDNTSKRPPVSSTATKSTTMKVSVKIMCEKGAAYVKTTPKGPVNVVEKAVQIITIRRRVPSDSEQNKNNRNVPVNQSDPGEDDTNPLSIREKNIQRLKQLIKRQEQAIEKIKSGKEKQIDLETDGIAGLNQDHDVIVIDEEENTDQLPEQNINSKTDTGKSLITKKTIAGTRIMTVHGNNQVSARDNIPGSMKLTISGGKVTSVQHAAITEGKVTSDQAPAITKVTPVKILPAPAIRSAAIASTGGTDGLPKITGICSLAGMKQIPNNMLTTDELDKAINYLAKANDGRSPSRIVNLSPNDKQDILKTLQQARTLMYNNIQKDSSATGTVTTTISLATTGQRVAQAPTTAGSVGNSIILTSTLKTGERRITLVPALAKPKKQPNALLSATPVQRNVPRVKYTSLGLPYAIDENEQSDRTETVTASNARQSNKLMSAQRNGDVHHLPPSVNLQYPPSNQGAALGHTAMEAPINRQSDIQMLNNLVSKQGQRVNNTPGFTVGTRPRLMTLSRPGAGITNAARAMPGGMARGLPQNSIIHRQQVSINTSGIPASGHNSGQANSGLEPVFVEHDNINAMPVGSNIPQVRMRQPGQLPSETQQVQIGQPAASNRRMPVGSNTPQVQMLQPGQPPSETQQVQIRQPVAPNNAPDLQNIQPQIYQRVVLIQDKGSYALVPIPANANIPGSFHVPVDHRQLMNNQMPQGTLPPYGLQYQGHPNMPPHQGLHPSAVPDPRAEATLPGNLPAASSNLGQVNPPQMPRLAPIDPLAAAGNMASESKQAAPANEAECDYLGETQSTGNTTCKTVPESTAEVLPESADIGKKDTLVEGQGARGTKLIIKMSDMAQKKSLFNILPKPSEGTLPELTPVSGHAELLVRLANRTQVRGCSFSETKAILQNSFPRSIQVSNINLPKAIPKEAPLKVYPEETFDTSPYWLKHAAKHRIAEQFRWKIASSKNSTSGISNSISRKSNAQTIVSEKGTSSSKEITSGKSNLDDEVSKENNSGGSNTENSTSEKASVTTDCSATENPKKIGGEKGSSENIDPDKTKRTKLDAKPSLVEQIFQQMKKRSPNLHSKFAVRFGSYENQFSLVNTKRPLWTFLPAAENEEFILNFGLEEAVDRILAMPDMKSDKETDKETDEKEIEVTIDGKELLLDGKNVKDEDNPVHLWKNRIYVDAFKFSNTVQSEINNRKRTKDIADNNSKDDLKDDSESKQEQNTINGDDKSRKRARMVNSNDMENQDRNRERVITKPKLRDTRTKHKLSKIRLAEEREWDPDDHESFSEASEEFDSEEGNGQVSDSDETSDSDDEPLAKKYKLKITKAEELPETYIEQRLMYNSCNVKHSGTSHHIMTKMLLWPAFIFVAICCLLTQSYAAPTNRTATNSSEYTLVRAIPDTSAQVDLLQRMRMNNNMNVQFWRPPDWPGRHVDMWVPKTTKRSLMDKLKKHDILYDIKVTDWNITKDDVTMENIDFFDKKYHKLHQINSELKRLAKGYGDFVKLIEIGKSTEKRELLAIQMLKKSAKKKPLLFFLCGLHGREWLGIASCMYVLRMLILNSDYENDIQLITDNFEVIFLPNGNPDGYVHTHKVARFWRKSRSKTREDDCPGVDLNRNFNFRWGGDGASPDACDETFHGYRPFSESETRAIARYLFKRRNDMKAFVDVHTFGQLLTFPWGSLHEPASHFYKHVRYYIFFSQKLMDCRELTLASPQ